LCNNVALIGVFARGVKRTITFARDHTVAEALDQVKLWNSAYLLSNDLAEAAVAFMEKRDPVYKDH
jgi:enoyl-CoA hydratase